MFFSSTSSHRRSALCTEPFCCPATCTRRWRATKRRREGRKENGSLGQRSGSFAVLPISRARLETPKAQALLRLFMLGFRTLFEGGHVPQASFHGTASKEDGLADLKKWLATLPRSTNVVIYCGCCPFDRCPNIRPAYTALRDTGFHPCARAGAANELRGRLGRKGLSHAKRSLKDST